MDRDDNWRLAEFLEALASQLDTVHGMLSLKASDRPPTYATPDELPKFGALVGVDDAGEVRLSWRPNTPDANPTAEAGGPHASTAGSAALANLVSRIDFEGFAVHRLHTLFRMIVEIAIGQMDAFSELLSEVSKSVDKFMHDNLSEEEVRTYAAVRHPDDLEVDLLQEPEQAVPRIGTVEGSGSVPATKAVIEASGALDAGGVNEVQMASHLARSRVDSERMLLVMVMMGLKDFEIRNGPARALVTFDLHDSLRRRLSARGDRG